MDGSPGPAFVGGALRPTGGVAQRSSKASSRSRYTGEVANHAEQYIGTGITYLSDTVHINACECSGKLSRRTSVGTRRSTEHESSLFRATALEPTSEYGRPVSSGALRPTGMGQAVSKNTRRRTHVRWGSAPHGYGVCSTFFDTQGRNRACLASDKDWSAQVYRAQQPRLKRASLDDRYRARQANDASVVQVSALSPARRGTVAVSTFNFRRACLLTSVSPIGASGAGGA